VASVRGFQIKAHPFFAGIDWDALVRKEITPPWIPSVSTLEDVSLISPQWTDRVPRVRISLRFLPTSVFCFTLTPPVLLCLS
jgi:hypothetical protein